MAKVYVVIGGWDYEGYDQPVAVVNTKRQAKKAFNSASENHSYDNLYVYEYTLGEIPCEPTEVKP